MCQIPEKYRKYNSMPYVIEHVNDQFLNNSIYRQPSLQKRVL